MEDHWEHQKMRKGKTMRRFHNPRYAPEFLERKLSPSTAMLVPVAAEVSMIPSAADDFDAASSDDDSGPGSVLMCDDSGNGDPEPPGSNGPNSPPPTPEPGPH